jgi:hypothetical protein
MALLLPPLQVKPPKRSTTNDAIYRITAIRYDPVAAIPAIPAIPAVPAIPAITPTTYYLPPPSPAYHQFLRQPQLPLLLKQQLPSYPTVSLLYPEAVDVAHETIMEH